MDMNIHRVTKIEVTKDRDMNEGDDQLTPSYVRTIKITSHANSNVDETQTFEITLFGSDDVHNIEAALQIKI